MVVGQSLGFILWFIVVSAVKEVSQSDSSFKSRQAAEGGGGG